MARMVRCSRCKKMHEGQNFKKCDKCHVVACAWCIGGGSVQSPTSCPVCRKGRTRKFDVS